MSSVNPEEIPQSYHSHRPVMLDEVLQYLQPQNGKIYVDATFGAGGYSRAILEAAPCTVYAIDRDPNTRMFAEKLSSEFADRFIFLTGCFSQMTQLLAECGIHQVDGIVMDLGVSSMQLDEAERGFSFMRDGPLDMRQSASGISAADIVNETAEAELANILYLYGEEKKSRRIARAICEARQEQPITTTLQLAEIIQQVIRQGAQKIHPATRSFQALRIAVNRELEELEQALQQSPALLHPHGRIVVVSFHSLEDRIAKRFFTTCSQTVTGKSRHQPVTAAEEAAISPLFTLPVRKAVKASPQEAETNSRARSAKLRVAERSQTPMHQGELS